jgi:polysaccharide export outer membrane protein
VGLGAAAAAAAQQVEAMNKTTIAMCVLAAALVVPAPAATAQSKPASVPSQSGNAAQQKAPAVSPAQAPGTQVAPPADYVIGTDDVLVVVYRHEKDMSAEVLVRPDGKITLPVLNDIVVAGLTPDQLRVRVAEEARRFLEGDPSVTVIVKAINSRKVFITGQVARPGSYPLGTRMTVVQLIAMAGGLTEFAKGKDIVIIRDAPGTGRPGAKPTTFRFNYEDVAKLKNLASNIDLKLGDTVIVP